ncbi:hypothetical protein HanHA300_Chr10g0374611 [Helianthus annuus]|nr:hypothetical protein HanHA300_Chr10g0374611 [Helianthus annuus]KAJ0531052.1 hypothetical protein HanHA89_Chr10g0396831 [Helianthus annuus]KAJ0697900.1 hypothetical protein HanLR1_Chr10g0374201 [Helianthus annuus]
MNFRRFKKPVDKMVDEIKLLMGSRIDQNGSQFHGIVGAKSCRAALTYWFCLVLSVAFLCHFVCYACCCICFRPVMQVCFALLPSFSVGCLC